MSNSFSKEFRWNMRAERCTLLPNVISFNPRTGKKCKCELQGSKRRASGGWSLLAPFRTGYLHFAVLPAPSQRSRRETSSRSRRANQEPQSDDMALVGRGTTKSGCGTRSGFCLRSSREARRMGLHGQGDVQLRPGSSFAQRPRLMREKPKPDGSLTGASSASLCRRGQGS